MIRQANVNELTKHLKELIKTKRTLTHISGFKQWLINLYGLGYLQRECAYERKAAEANTPADKETLRRVVENDLKEFNFTMDTEFCLRSFQVDKNFSSCSSREQSRIIDKNNNIKEEVALRKSNKSSSISIVEDNGAELYRAKIESATPSKTNLISSDTQLVSRRGR